jgi:predicted O-linked N-acetylglucosamine transferase (SPINDLY family)
MNPKKPQVNPNILFQQAFQLQQNGRAQDAELIYKNLLQISPSHIGAKTMLGIIYVLTERDIEGVRLLKSSLNKDPKQFWAHNALGCGLFNTKQYQEAIFNFNKALILKPDYTDAYFNLGKTQRALGHYKDAIVSYSKCINLDKSYADAYNNRGTIYLENLKNYENAVTNFQQFLTLAPESFQGFYNLGNALKQLERYEEALLSYSRAIHLKPDYAEAYFNQGLTFGELGRHEDALLSYSRAIHLKPDYAEAYYNQGLTFSELRCYDDALASYGLAIQLKPKMDYLLGNLMHTKMLLCDWANFYSLVNQLTESLVNKEIVTTPFVTLALIDNPELQKQSAEIFINENHPLSNQLPKIFKCKKNQKIRIGYFSADFRNHPVSYLTAELFELHNRDQFEIIAFSFALDTQDPIRKRLKKGFDKFIDVRDKSNTQIASLAREMGIDIAVDLGGHTRDSRLDIFAMRAAPIQISYIGYLGTIGAQYFDYLMADQFLIPQDKKESYSEKIAYLPSYQVNDSKQMISKNLFTRTEIGLPENAFVFCCFNNTYKITPSTFDSWMRILNEVNGSVLLLLDANETAKNNLKKEATVRGVDANRLIFGKPLPLPEYIARYRIANLFLDTLPYNAGTTASDALRVGLPVLTQMGGSFASRMGASILNAVGLPDLITTSPKEYESLAIKLATHPDQLEEIRSRLFGNLSTSPLYNTKLFAHHIELAYQEMYKRNQEELPPDHIYIEN